MRKIWDRSPGKVWRAKSEKVLCSSKTNFGTSGVLKKIDLIEYEKISTNFSDKHGCGSLENYMGNSSKSPSMVPQSLKPFVFTPKHGLCFSSLGLRVSIDYSLVLDSDNKVCKSSKRYLKRFDIPSGLEFW